MLNFSTKESTPILADDHYIPPKGLPPLETIPPNLMPTMQAILQVQKDMRIISRELRVLQQFSINAQMAYSDLQRQNVNLQTKLFKNMGKIKKIGHSTTTSDAPSKRPIATTKSGITAQEAMATLNTLPEAVRATLLAEFMITHQGN